MRRTLEFRLGKPVESDAPTAVDLSIWLDGRPAWPVLGEDDAGVDVFLDDLLSYLTDFWKPLMLRQVYPIPIMPDRPSCLRDEAKKRWATLSSEEAVEREDAIVEAFAEAHDLSTCFAGVYGLPSFWLLRDRQHMVCETGGRLWRLPFNVAEEVLVSLGETVAGHLERVGSEWAPLVEAWRARESGDAIALLAWSAGLDRQKAGELVEQGSLEPPASLADASNDNDELRIAARMAGELPAAQIRTILSLARDFDQRAAPGLRQLSKVAIEYLDQHPRDLRPYTRGEMAAIFVREKLGLNPFGPIDIFTIVEDLGVVVKTQEVEPVNFDGLAIWGRRFGPGVFLNTASFRILRAQEPRRSGGARVTLAHEFCHLLLDSSHALSAVDVLKGRMPTAVEQCARSFAGELLLPTSSAEKEWIAAGRPQSRFELSKLVALLSRRYVVTRSVASWKIEHATLRSDIDVEVLLDQIVPGR